MGNHEFCTECGASDFHRDTPCNPERKAKYQAELKKNEHYRQEGARRAQSLLKRLAKEGYDVDVDPSFPAILRVRCYPR